MYKWVVDEYEYLNVPITRLEIALFRIYWVQYVGFMPAWTSAIIVTVGPFSLAKIPHVVAKSMSNLSPLSAQSRRTHRFEMSQTHTKV